MRLVATHALTREYVNSYINTKYILIKNTQLEINMLQAHNIGISVVSLEVDRYFLRHN